MDVQTIILILFSFFKISGYATDCDLILTCEAISRQLRRQTNSVKPAMFAVVCNRKQFLQCFVSSNTNIPHPTWPHPTVLDTLILIVLCPQQHQHPSSNSAGHTNINSALSPVTPTPSPNMASSNSTGHTNTNSALSPVTPTPSPNMADTLILIALILITHCLQQY